MKIKTQDLTGAALDWAVAKCEGVDQYLLETAFMSNWDRGRWNFAGDWAQGGPIIERKRIGIDGMGIDNAKAGEVEAFKWTDDEHEPLPLTATGPTPLIACMRCYVASQLGDEVDIPDELVEA